MKEEKNDKSKKILVTTIIILVACIVGLVTFILTTLLVKPNHQIEQKEQEIIAKDIKDIDVITELSTKIDTILSKETTQYYQSLSSQSYNYRYIVLKEELTDAIKQGIILENITWENIPQESYEQTKEIDLMKVLSTSGYPIEHLLTTTKQVSLDKVSKYSQKLFGEKITSPVKNINRCPSYSYEESTKMYYFPEPQCGGLNSNLVKSYKSKFEDRGMEAHVYVSFAFLATSGTNSILDKYTIYKDFTFQDDPSYGIINYKDAYQTGLDQESAENFIVDSSNYQNFSEYKFIFKKDKTNNYYLVKVEQTK